MSKNKSSFQCSACGRQSLKWAGCCPTCNEWNTFEEIAAVSKNAARFTTTPLSNATPRATVTMHKISTVVTRTADRMISGIKEWDRVTGGGLMPGAFIILTGDPGIGKSTLLMQIAYSLAKQQKVLYFSSEESLEQVTLRARRLNCIDSELLLADQANLDQIIATSHQEKPAIIIVDSIQNCYSDEVNALPGTIGQLKESAFRLMRFAKENTVAVILSGHITKDGVIAGPKALEHMVDAVFYLQGEDRWQVRVLRSVKNRFGAINELGFFEMLEHGLQEMPNINKYLLETVTYSPGSALVSYIEGSRPLLLELQALTIASKFGMPQRVVSGIDQTQVVLIAAILEKYLGVKLSTHDIFFKVSGGFKIKASSADLAIALALLSSYFQKPVPQKSLALGEISLTGHIKPVNYLPMHIGEASKFGITTVMISQKQKVENSAVKALTFSHVYELLKLFTDE